MTSMLAAAAVLVGVLAGPEPEDDLTVVRRAVGAPAAPAASVRQAAPEAPPKVGAPTRKTEKAPQWLRVRVVDKGSKKAKVSVNVPLALVRALGDDCPISWCGRRPRHSEANNPRLSEVLAALESGESLVEIDDGDATVRVWVD
jgi:hypothetical protein